MVTKKKTTKRKTTKRKTTTKPKKKDLTTWGGNKPNRMIYKGPLLGLAWREEIDVARSARQAKSIVGHYPPEYDAIIVKAKGKGKSVFPYSIWTIKDERTKRYRREQYKKTNGKRWS